MALSLLPEPSSPSLSLHPPPGPDNFRSRSSQTRRPARPEGRKSRKSTSRGGWTVSLLQRRPWGSTSRTRTCPCAPPGSSTPPRPRRAMVDASRPRTLDRADSYYIRGLAVASGSHCSFFGQLPDGVGTNGVVAEVPRFPIVNCCWKMWRHVRT